MSDPFLGEIQAFAFDFGSGGLKSSANWLPCNGQLLPVGPYAALFSLIGTYYGGNGTTNFQLPNLNGQIAMSQGQGPGLSDRKIGEQTGSMTETLQWSEMPIHAHSLQLGIKTAANATPGPGTSGSSAAIDPNFNGFVAPPAQVQFAANGMGITGGSQAHPNNQPTLALYYCIAITGIYPTFG
jgi:microcystin-dependent protein